MKNIAICISGASSHTETFIKAHIEFLNAKLYYKSELPIRSGLKTEKAQGVKSKIRKFYNNYSNFRKRMKLKQRIRNENIGVVLAEYGEMGVEVLETCKLNKIPLVVYFFGFDAYKKDVLEKYKHDYKELFVYSSALIVVSDAMKMQLISLGANEKKIHHVVCGADVSKFELVDVEKTAKVLLSIGRFVEKKAPYLTILAFEKVLSKIPDAKLYIVGDGQLFDVCKKIIVALKLQNNILLVGNKQHFELIDLMKMSRAYVQHSLVPESGDSEGTPVAIVEAQASGLPVVSTYHAGIQEVVIHGKTGYLVPENNIDLMAEYMVLLLENPQKAMELGMNGRQNVVQNYTLIQGLTKLKLILENNMVN